MENLKAIVVSLPKERATWHIARNTELNGPLTLRGVGQPNQLHGPTPKDAAKSLPVSFDV